MDDQNQANNQFGAPKKEQPMSTGSAPAEVEPATDSSVTPPVATTSSTPASSQPAATPASPVTPPQPSQVPQTPPTQPEEKMLEAPQQPGLLEAPRKKSGMLFALVAVALVVIFVVVGFLVYQAL